MSKFSEDEERDAIDNITNAMLSVGFLADISDFIFSANRNFLTVGQFYDKWIQEVLPKKHKPPLSPGIILALMYVAMMYGKERWSNIIPNIDIKEIDNAWGFKDASFRCSKKKSPTLRYIIRRLRNSLGHGNVKFIIPPDLKPEERLDKVKIEFHDDNPKDRSDNFDMALTLRESYQFI